MNEKLEFKQSSAHGDSGKHSKEGYSQRELLGLEDPQRATGQNLNLDTTEGLTEMIGTLVLQGIDLMPLRNERGGLGLRRVLLRNRTAANLGRFKAINRILS
jgi:hypothetical protein